MQNSAYLGTEQAGSTAMQMVYGQAGLGTVTNHDPTRLAPERVQRRYHNGVADRMDSGEPKGLQQVFQSQRNVEASELALNCDLH